MLPPSKNTPNRPTDWRWERARWLNESGKYARRDGEDPFVRAAKRFQSLNNKCHSELDQANLSEQFPGIFWAHELRKDQEKVTKFQVEARLLAGESVDRIANRCFLIPEVIQWYERLFFNVSDAMESLDYLCGVVVGRAIYHGVTDRDFDILWKLYAIGTRGQPDVLDSLFTTLGNATADAFFDDDTRSVLKRKASFAARTLPVAFNQRDILEIHTNLKGLEQIDVGSGDVHSLFKENVRMMMIAFGPLFSVARAGTVDVPQLAHYDGQAAELRAHELIEVAAGKETDAHRTAVEFKFPEAPSNGDKDQQGG